MLIGFLKRRPDGEMAARALCIDIRRSLYHQGSSTGSVNGMAPGAGDCVLSVAGHDATDVGRIVPMTAEARKVRVDWRHLGWLLNVLHIGAFCVFCPRTVARLAGHSRPAARMIGIDCGVRCF